MGDEAKILTFVLNAVDVFQKVIKGWVEFTNLGNKTWWVRRDTKTLKEPKLFPPCWTNTKKSTDLDENPQDSQAIWLIHGHGNIGVLVRIEVHNVHLDKRNGSLTVRAQKSHLYPMSVPVFRLALKALRILFFFFLLFLMTIASNEYRLCPVMQMTIYHYIRHSLSLTAVI